MALDRFDDDLNYVGNLGDDPKRDNGLSTPQFKSYFDKAGLAIQNFINNKLIPQIESAIDEGALLQQIAGVINRKLDKAGDVMTGNIDMNGQKITNLPTPDNSTDAANKEYVDSKRIPATVSLKSTGWATTTGSAPYYQTVAVADVLATDTPHWGVVYSETASIRLAEKTAFGLVDEMEAEDGSVTFTCFEDRPDTDLTIQMEVNR